MLRFTLQWYKNIICILSYEYKQTKEVKISVSLRVKRFILKQI